MNYTDVQIRQADAALKVLHEKNGFVKEAELWDVMGSPKQEYMIMVLCEVLPLAIRKINSYAITEEGEKAFALGFKAYVEEQERKAVEPPVVVAKEEKRPWWKLSRGEWLTVVTIFLSAMALLKDCVR